MKRYKSTTILGGGPPGKIVQCQSFDILILLVKYLKNHTKEILGQIRSCRPVDSEDAVKKLQTMIERDDFRRVLKLARDGAAISVGVLVL